MCGVAGFTVKGVCDKDSELEIREMLRRIRHRGPNEAGIFLSDQLVMGAVRLSILGLENGQQPISDEQGRFTLCYNGEVYNYLELRSELMALGYDFFTGSDTEVVLRAWQAWGEDCLPRFNGAFAFALYDRTDDSLYLVRDRYGKRPLYYTQQNGTLYFSSEIKGFQSISDVSIELDAAHLSSIFTLWTPLPQQSAFKDIKQVPLGGYFKFVTKSLRGVTNVYSQQDFSTNYKISTLLEGQEAVSRELRKAVELRLRSDVEVGLYLSGGLDSSILGAIAADKIGSGIRTYSVAFDDKEFDESYEQELMASHIGSKHFTLQADYRTITENFPKAVFHAEVPLFRTALVPLFVLSNKVRSDGIKVVITGEGADEAFLGYNIFKETFIRHEWHNLNEEQRFEFLRSLYPYLKHYNQDNSVALLGLYQQFSKEKYPGLFSHEIRIQNGLFSRRLIRNSTDSLDAVSAHIDNHHYFQKLNYLQRAQWLEFQTLLQGYLLSSQGDRMAMAHSVENRCPFLDPNVVNLSNAINRHFDSKAIEKSVLREAFKNDLPKEVLNKRKHPYRAPDSKAFVNENPDYMELLLSEAELKKLPYINTKFSSALTRKIMTTSPESISTKENQTFIFLLSLALLNNQFVTDREYNQTNLPISDILVKAVDCRKVAEEA